MALVFIPLRGQVVSLLVTFSTVIAELSALSLALTLNRFFETQVLVKCKSVFLYRHRLRLRFIAIGIMLSFVALEILASITARTAFIYDTKQEACISMMVIGGTGGKEVEREMETDLISHTCLKIEGDVFRQRLGNMSLVSRKVQCSDNAIYEYNISQQVMQSTSSVQKHCQRYEVTTIPDITRVDASDEHQLLCVFYEYDGDRLLISTSFTADVSGSENTFFETRLHFNASSQVEDILDNVHDAYDRFETAMGLDGRRRILTVSRERECEFEYDKLEGTEVPVYVIAMLVTLWAVLFVANVAAFALSRSKKFVDLSDPFLWASMIKRNENIFSRKSLRVDLMEEDDTVMVSDSNQNYSLSVSL